MQAASHEPAAGLPSAPSPPCAPALHATVNATANQACTLPCCSCTPHLLLRNLLRIKPRFTAQRLLRLMGEGAVGAGRAAKGQVARGGMPGESWVPACSRQVRVEATAIIPHLQKHAHWCILGATTVACSVQLPKGALEGRLALLWASRRAGLTIRPHASPCRQASCGTSSGDAP